FSWFSFYHKNGRFGTLIGSFIYLFSGYYLLYVAKHLMFGVPILTFPLILLGIDKIFKEKKSLLFILSVTLAALSNIYFLYIQIVLAVFYAVYRYFCTYKRFELKNFVQVLFRFILYGLNAFLLSAVMILPSLYMLLNATRLGADNKVMILYQLSYYFKLIANFTNLQIPEYSWMTMFYPSIAVAAVIVMFVKKGEYKGEKIVFIVLNIFALIPFFGLMFNGFGYVLNRWQFAYALAVGVIFARIYPRIKELTFKERRTVAVAMAIIAALSLVISVTRTTQTYASVALLLAVAVCLLLFDLSKIPGYRIGIAVILFYFISTGTITYLVWDVASSKDGNDTINKFHDFNTADLEVENNNSDKVLHDIADEGMFRISEIDVSSPINSASNRGVAIPSRWYSFLTPQISKYTREMYLNTILDYRIYGTERRSILDAINSVKYYIVKEGSENKLPFNYRNKVNEAETYDGRASLYTADVVLPLGYSYDEEMSWEEFKPLNIAQRQEALIQRVLIGNDDQNIVKEQSSLEKVLDLESENVLQSLDTMENKDIEINENGIKVNCEHGVVRAKIKPVKEADLYAAISGLSYKDIRVKDTYSKDEWNSLSGYERHMIADLERWELDRGDISIGFGTNEGSYDTSLKYYTPNQLCYTGHDNYLLSLGYCEDEVNEVYIYFKNPGYYNFDSLDIYMQPYDGLNDKLSKLAAEPLENISKGNNKITGTVDFSKDKTLCISVPYSEGWTAFVDGQKTEILPANIAYMGIRIPKGHHDVVLTYETPWLRTGAYLTIAGFLMLVVMIILQCLKKTKERP
ncbi:MAG: YfhO family protein, partial [Lachnospiraceae bacterium]|nr:YfhO family protein [Lachnospiraceae bacterium]